MMLCGVVLMGDMLVLGGVSIVGWEGGETDEWWWEEVH